MFIAKVYKVMIGSLSGAMEEVYVAKEAVHKWNQNNSERTGKMLLLVDWNPKMETIQDIDLLIGIVGNRVEYPDFVKWCIEADKQVMLFFNAFQDSKNTIPRELKEVQEFKNKTKDYCTCVEYYSIVEFLSLMNERFALIK